MNRERNGKEITVNIIVDGVMITIKIPDPSATKQSAAMGWLGKALRAVAMVGLGSAARAVAELLGIPPIL